MYFAPGVPAGNQNKLILLMKKLLLLAFVVVFSSTSFAQTTTNTKTEKIKKLLVVSGTGELGVQAMKNMVTMFKQSYSNVNDEFWNEFMIEVSADELIELLIPIYDKHYTEEDVAQLIVFYQSPLGKKMVQVMPGISQESMAAGQEWGKKMGEKVVNRLKEKGYVN